MRDYEMWVKPFWLLIIFFTLGFGTAIFSTKHPFPVNLPTSLAQPENDGRTEWTKEGKAKLRAEWAKLQKLHDKWESETGELYRDNSAGNQWLVVLTTCGVGINNMVHGGWWPYSSTRGFDTESGARKFMDRWCDPHGCVLIYGVPK